MNNGSDAIFLIPPVRGGAWCWDRYETFFEKRGYRCHKAWAQTHETDSAVPAPPATRGGSLLDYADSLEHEILQLDSEPILMGHSAGALLAQLLSGRGLGRELVLLAPFPPPEIRETSPSLDETCWDQETRWNSWNEPIRMTFDEAAKFMLNRVPTQSRRTIYDRLVDGSEDAIAQIGYWFEDPGEPILIDESDVPSRVLVVAGAEDRITPPSVVRETAEKHYPRSTYRVFDEHAHWMIGERGWEDIAGYIATWLRWSSTQLDRASVSR